MLTCLAVGLLFLVYVGLFKWNITNVPTRVMQVSDISQLKDGRIVYHVKMTDGYNVNQASYDTDEEGNFYITPKRPIIKSKRFANMGLSNMYYFNDIKEREKSFGDGVQIKALYLGTPDDRILIWEQGMERRRQASRLRCSLRVMKMKTRDRQGDHPGLKRSLDL